MKLAESMARPFISLSVVSHGQGHLVEALLHDVRSWPHVRVEVIVTLNIAESDRFIASFSDLTIKVIWNAMPKGFGANHNSAFAQSTGDIFIVANPDIRAPHLDLSALIETTLDPHVGACAPLVLSVDGKIEDSARRFPTVERLAKRVVLKRRSADFDVSKELTAVDWVAGMFIVFSREAFKRVGGFDERYFMYMEDADICRRLSKLHLAVVVDPRCKVVHEARRASRRNLQHLRWHVRSAVRFLFGI